MIPKSVIGAGIDRVDGPLKVTGSARYAGDTQLAGMVYAVPVLSTIARGDIVAMDTQAASEAPGVLTVITRKLDFAQFRWDGVSAGSAQAGKHAASSRR
jgi:xanthine dehydrogenase YagR molybdenum-binding subunit